jgi:uracil-DNA glycosylase
MNYIRGWELGFFNSGEWQVCDERLSDLEKASAPLRANFNPKREDLFRALRCTPFEEVKVAIIGQDPYPQSRFATGIAFSIPPDVARSEYPPTLRTFLGEYRSDLGYSHPSTGDLSTWTKRGVLLWNAVPSCRAGHSLSHDWPEWEVLTKEIVTKLAKKGIVFALLGQVAQRCANYISDSNNVVLRTSHPSPRGSASSKSPFVGSRLFSTINAKLNEQALKPVDWRLP